MYAANQCAQLFLRQILQFVYQYGHRCAGIASGLSNRDKNIAQVVLKIAAVGITCLGVYAQGDLRPAGGNGDVADEAAQHPEAFFHGFDGVLQSIQAQQQAP